MEDTVPTGAGAFVQISYPSTSDYISSTGKELSGDYLKSLFVPIASRIFPEGTTIAIKAREDHWSRKDSRSAVIFMTQLMIMTGGAFSFDIGG